MHRLDENESELLGAYEGGRLKSVASKSELGKLKAAARATAVKDKRINIRLSSLDLSDIQVRALEEGVPYQTLIASILHKYVTGRLTERTGPEQTPRIGPASEPRGADSTPSSR